MGLFIDINDLAEGSSVVGFLILGAVILAMFPFAYARPQRGLLVFAALVPFHGLLPLVPSGVFPAFWKEALLLAVVVAAVLSPNRDSGRAPAMPWLRFSLGLMALSAVSAAVVHGLWGLLPLKVTAFYALLIPPIVMVHPFTSRDRDSLVTIIMGVSVLTGAYGIVQQFVGGEELAAWGYSWNDQLRTAGPLLRSFSTFSLPFPFGLYEMMALLVGGAVALSAPRRPRNVVFLICSPIVVAGMAVSVVRGSYLGLIVGVVFLAVVAYRRLRVPIACTAVACVGALVLLPQSVTANLLSSNSLGARSAGWTQMLSDLTYHPFGQGLGLTGAAADKLAKQIGAARVPYQPDNYYMKLGLELGPIGIVLFVAVLVVGYKAMMRTWRFADAPDDRAFGVGVAAFVLAAAAASVVSTFLEIFPLDVYFWLLLSVGGLDVVSSRKATVTEPTRLMSTVRNTASRPIG